MKKSILIFMIVFTAQLTFAQIKTVKGTVTDEAGIPLPGATISVQGESNATISDGNGNFTIEANKGKSLKISFIGMETKSALVGDQNTVNVKMASASSNSLNEVVVTALGIKKSRKSLTYSAQDIKGDELTKVKESNLINSLSGKVAGLEVSRSSSGVGGSVKVQIRGASSVTNNQPLYVIDGVPMFNSSNTQPNSVLGDAAGGNRDGGDIISLLNPDDVESLTVLSGASASALYGSQAGVSGVILITTKKGKAGKTTVTVSSSTITDNVSVLPKFQTEFAATIDEKGKYAIGGWGAKQAVTNHVPDFFSTGVSQNTSVNASFGSEKAQTYLSYSNLTSSGIIPTNDLKRHNVNLRETINLFNDKLIVDASIIGTTQEINNRPSNGLYFNPLTGLYLQPRGQDYNDLKNNFEKYNIARNIYAQNWDNINDTQQNPFWILNRNKSNDITQRFLLSTGLEYKATDWLSFKSRYSYDKSYSTFDRKIYATTAGALSPEAGRYILDEYQNTQQYADLIATANKKFDNKFSLNLILGTSVTNSNTGNLNHFDSGVGTGLGKTNYFSLGNFTSATNIYQRVGAIAETQSVFSSATLGYNDYLFLDLTARKDWSSTLAFTKQAPVYPSIGATAILSDMIKMPEAISFAKIRASYAVVGSSLPAFLTNPQYFLIGGGLTTQPVLSAPKDATLLPQRQDSYELGTEWKFFSNKLQFNFTYYNSITKNQLIRAINSSATFGADNFAASEGEIENKGVTLSLSVKPYTSENFSWNTGINYAMNKNLVKSLLNNAPLLLTHPGTDSYRYQVEVGQPFGVIQGFNILKDNQGRVILDDKGDVQKTDWQNLGQTAPKFTLGWSNSFTYKNLFLNVLIDGKFGGKVLSLTQAELDLNGVSQATADARNAGGVTLNTTKGVVTIPADTYYGKVGGRAGISGEYVYDATNVTLRELSIGITPKFIKGASISLVGRNLFFFYKKAPYDPNITSSTGEGLQGIDIFGLPSTRSIGLNLKLTL